MIPFLSIPRKIIKLLEGNIAPSEVAAGVCMGMFLGFIPLYGMMALVLFVMFLLFKLNRISALLTFPVFKLIYVLGLYKLADFLGGLILIDVGFLKGFWHFVIRLPIVAYLDLGNTLVTGGLLLSGILCAPLYFASKKATVIVREKYAEKIANSAVVKWFKRVFPIHKLVSFLNRVKGN